MKKIIYSLVGVLCLLVIVGCGKKEKIVGTWYGETNDGLETTFVFKSNGNVTYENSYGINSEGTYKVKDDIITISLATWDVSKEYKFEIKDNKLSLTAQDGYSPSYTDMIKK